MFRGVQNITGMENVPGIEAETESPLLIKLWTNQIGPFCKLVVVEIFGTLYIGKNEGWDVFCFKVKKKKKKIVKT